MIRYLFLVLFINLCCSCDMKPNTISEISGTWRTIEISTPFGNSTTVEKPSRSEARILIIRNDGVMLNRSGQVICCFSENYKVNGVLVEVKKTAYMSDPLCKIFDCPSVDGLKVHKI